MIDLKGRGMLRSIMPVVDLVALHWNKYLLRNINPLSPYAPGLVLRINALEGKVEN